MSSKTVPVSRRGPSNSQRNPRDASEALQLLSTDKGRIPSPSEGPQKQDKGETNGGFLNFLMPTKSGPKMPIIDDIPSTIECIQERQELVEIFVEGVFEEEMADDFELDMQKAIESGHKMVLIRINSPGGSVYALNRMLSTMELAKNVGVICMTVCTGIAMSCGSILLAMGTPGYRYCSSHSRVLLHQISGGIQGKFLEMKNELNEYEADNRDLFRKIALNANVPDEYYLDLVLKLNRDIFIHPAAALYFKLVDHIGLPQITRKVTFQYVVTNTPDLTAAEIKERMIQEQKRYKDNISQKDLGQAIKELADWPAPDEYTKNAISSSGASSNMKNTRTSLAELYH